MIFEYDYEPTPTETEIFLSQESLELLMNHIESQFDNPLDQTYDYVSTFIENYKYSETLVVDEEDEMTLDALCDTFIQFILKMFSTRLDVELSDPEGIGTEPILDIIHMVYRYFIINIKHNFSSYCKNYIDQNYDRLVEEAPRRKDVTSINLRKELGEIDDIYLISNLPDIVDQILHTEDITVDKFLSHSDYNDPRLETEMVNEYYNDFTVVGNFCNAYLRLLSYNGKKEIVTKIRRFLYKKIKSKNTI